MLDRNAMWNRCRTIEENSLYSAQAHFEEAKAARAFSRWMIFVPSVLAFGAGAAVVLGAPTDWGVLALVGGLASGFGGLFDLGAKVYRHDQEGNEFVALRHDAEALRVTFGPLKSDAELESEVMKLHNRYDQLVRLTQTTSERSFKRARIRIQAGVFEPDNRDVKE